MVPGACIIVHVSRAYICRYLSKVFSPSEFKPVVEPPAYSIIVVCIYHRRVYI